MSRAADFEKAVKQYLDLKKISYLRIENYRCFKCGQIQNSKAKGFPDFYCYGLKKHLAIECKTGTGRLSKEQREIKKDMEATGDKYIVLHDTIDELIEYFNVK